MTSGLFRFIQSAVFFSTLSFPMTVMAIQQEAGGSPVYVRGVATRIVDGDTIRFRPDSANLGDKDWSIRMLGMDAPEQHFPVPGQGMLDQGAWGEKATEYLAKILPVGSPVTLATFGKDKYRRVLARIEFNGADINLEMVRAGQAIPYIICEGRACDSLFFKNQAVENYVEACEEAQAKGKGIFNKRNPLKELPYQFRLRVGNRNPDKFVGNFKTRELYEPAEMEKVADPCERIFFYSEQKAVDLDFKRAEN